MSTLSSLSVWSSVKFPFPKFYQDIERGKSFGVESCDNLQRDHEKVRGEKATEMVNLTVPWSQNVNKENSVPNLYCECTRNQKKSKKKNKHVKFVTVPDIVYFVKENVSLEKFPDSQTTNLQDESDLIPGDKYYECQPEEVEENEDNTCIPSVKPWTLEELTAINNEIKERENKMKMRRNRRRENILKNHVKELESFSKSFPPDESFTPSENFTCDSFLPFTQQFYECDRYCSKLGLNSGFTKKTHKIR